MIIDFIIELSEIDYQKIIDTIFIIINRFIKYFWFIFISIIFDIIKFAELFYSKIELEYKNLNKIILD